MNTKILILFILLPFFAFPQAAQWWRAANQGTVPPVLVDSVLVFQICNSNAVTDDNFDIYLNSIKIGAVDLNDDAEIGSVFFGTTYSSYTLIPDFTCSMSDMVIYLFNWEYLVIGTNQIEMRNTQNNGEDNKGSIGVRIHKISVTGDTLLGSPRVVADIQFQGDSGWSFMKYFEY
jgi:hypothetical protein